MSRPEVQTRVLLLVEDNPGDAELVSDLLADASREHYQIVHVPSLATALEALRTRPVDVIVLDLHLPDCVGIDSVKTIREHGGAAPIVVLTGSNDEQLALACIDAGAQDYLSKSEARAPNLKRAIGYAITRLRESQVRELQATLDRYRELSSATQSTSVTAALAGSGAVAIRSPETFDGLVKDYFALLEPYLARNVERIELPREVMEWIVTALGDAGGGPRDLLDIHVAALDRAIARADNPHSWSIVFEARLLALEMMGLLVDYYRVGHRRRFVGGLKS